jgi:hypothetical protein
VTEQLTNAEANVIKTYERMQKLHENFKVVADADSTIRKGLANRSMSPTSEAAYAAEDEAVLGAYVEVVDRVGEAMVFLKRNIKMRSAELTLRQLEAKQQRMLSDLRDEIFRLLSSGSQSVVNRGQGEFQVRRPPFTGDQIRGMGR